MCNSSRGSLGEQAIEIERGTPQLEVEEHADSMGQDLADEAMLEMRKRQISVCGERRVCLLGYPDPRG